MSGEDHGADGAELAGRRSAGLTKEYVETVAAATTVAAVILYGVGWTIVSLSLSPLGITPEEVGVSWSWLLARVGPIAAVICVVVALALGAVLRGPPWVQLVVGLAWLPAAVIAEAVNPFAEILTYATGVAILTVMVTRLIETRRHIAAMEETIRQGLDRDRSPETSASDRAALEQLQSTLDALKGHLSVGKSIAVYTTFILVQVALLGRLTFRQLPGDLRTSLLDGTVSAESSLLVVVPRVSIEGLDPEGACVLLLGRNDGVAVVLRYNQDDAVVRLPTDREMSTSCTE